ncbi:response regulator [bacterium]|nr:response regulator [bacterium]
MKNPFRVLIVEDERLTAKSLQFYIEDLGAMVLEPVVKGEEAVEVALLEHPDLILMDIRLAGRLDGIEAAEKIHAEKNIPIVFMTGYATELVQKDAHKIHPVSFLEKPVNLDKVREIVNRMIH